MVDATKRPVYLFKPWNTLAEEGNLKIVCIFAKSDMILVLHTLSSFDNSQLDNVIMPHGAGCEVMLTFAFA